MPILPSSLLVVALAASCADQSVQSTSRAITVQLAIPADVAEASSARIRGDARAPSPLLVLEGVEVGAGEALKIQVVAWSERPMANPLQLGYASMVGGLQGVPDKPTETLKLVIPLNDDGAALLAKATADVKVVLQPSGNPERGPLKYVKAYLTLGGK